MKKIYISKGFLPFIITCLLLIFPVQGTIHLPPRTIKAPEDITFEIGTTGNQLIWQFFADESQDSPSTYSIKVNGSLLVEKEAWQDKLDIVLIVDEFSLGVHIVQIQVNDTGVDIGAAPPAFDEVKVTVVEKGLLTLQTSEVNNTKTASFPFLVLFFATIAILLFNKKRRL